MKKIASGFLALLMATILPMNQVLAQELSLDSAISNLQYSLTVEWDQKDLKAQKAILGAFAADVETLKKQGISDAQIFQALSDRAFDAQTSKDIEQLAAFAKNKKLDQKEVRKLVVDYANKSQKLGTSWSSEATFGLVIGIVLVVVLIAALTGGVTVSNNGGYDYDCYEECFYDYYGYYTCDTYCY